MSPSSKKNRSRETVKAAGALVWRENGKHLEVLLVHRPRYDDWSIPKGKVDSCESVRTCAVREVAEELGISVSYLHKLFARCGTSFSAYLTECRLHRAGKMLRESDEKIYVIAAACGYQDTRYFSKIFQKHTGLKPTEYRSEKIS